MWQSPHNLVAPVAARSPSHTRGRNEQVRLTPGAITRRLDDTRGQCVHLTRIFRPHTRCTGPGYEAECIFWPRV